MPDAPALLPATRRPAPEALWAVTSLKQLETSNGIAFTATVRLDGKIVGTLENEGRGGATHFCGRSADANRAWLDEARSYVKHLDGGGEAAAEEELAEVLLHEYETRKMLDRWAKTAAVILPADQDPGALDVEYRKARQPLNDAVRALVRDQMPGASVWAGEDGWIAP